MVVAVAAVATVKASVVEEIDVITVGNTWVCAIVVALALNRLAVRRVGGTDFYHMFVVMIAMLGVKMAVVDVVRVVVMLNSSVPAILAMFVVMRWKHFVFRHRFLL